MPEHHLELDLTGTSGRLLLNGDDLTHSVQSFTLTAGNNELPRLSIEALVFTGHARGGGVIVEVELSDEVRRLLILEGWTPPASTDGDQ